LAVSKIMAHEGLPRDYETPAMLRCSHYAAPASLHFCERRA
jgi:hypothetical protein